MGKFRFAGVFALILAFSVGSFVAAPLAFAKEEQSKQKKKECEEAEQKAQKACNDSAPAAQQAQQQQNQQAQNQGGSAQGNCANRAQSLMPLLGLLSALQGGCQQAQAECEQKCGQAKQSPGTDCNDEDAMKKPQCQKTAGDTGQTGGEKGNKCQQLDKNLATIAQKIAEAMANLAAAKKCEEQTNKDCKDPTFAAQNPAQCKPAFNCNVPESFAGDEAKTKQCKCLQNPRGEGCDGYAAPGEGVLEAAKKGAAETTLPSTGGIKPSAGGGLGGSPNATSGPQSGGLAGSGAGGGRQGSAEKGGGSARDGVNGKNDPTQVNAGEYGGSGGSSRNAGGGYPDAANPARGPAVAGKKILTRNEMNMMRGNTTGAYGRSNWQKIHDRYRDNHPTFTP